jgi:hypothetical protein
MPVLRALAALGLLLAWPGAAQPLDEVGASFGLTFPALNGLGPCQTLSALADGAPAPWLCLRVGFRASTGENMDGTALGQPSIQTIGTLYELAPSFSALVGGDAGPMRIQGGVGLSYDVRFALTDDNAVGLPLVTSGATSFGTVRQLRFTFDPGVDAVVEAGIVIPFGLRLFVGVAGTLAGGRLLVQPREDANLEVAIPMVLFAWTLQVGVRWRVKGDSPTGPGAAARG